MSALQEIEQIQTAIGTDADGQFGPMSKAALANVTPAQIEVVEGILGTDKDGVFGPDDNAALSKLLQLAIDSHPPFTFTIDGQDVVVMGVTVTAFGGIEDCIDKEDDGHTESGHDTATRDADGNWHDTGLLCCALPVRYNEAATRPSPLAIIPQIPWGMMVKFWIGDEANPTFEITVPLYDNGPDVRRFPTHDGDLSKFAALKVIAALGMHISSKQVTNAFSATMNYRVIGVAHLFANAA